MLVSSHTAIHSFFVACECGYRINTSVIVKSYKFRSFILRPSNACLSFTSAAVSTRAISAIPKFHRSFVDEVELLNEPRMNITYVSDNHTMMIMSRAWYLSPVTTCRSMTYCLSHVIIFTVWWVDWTLLRAVSVRDSNMRAAWYWSVWCRDWSPFRSDVHSLQHRNTGRQHWVRNKTSAALMNVHSTRARCSWGPQCAWRNKMYALCATATTCKI